MASGISPRCVGRYRRLSLQRIDEGVVGQDIVRLSASILLDAEADGLRRMRFARGPAMAAVKKYFISNRPRASPCTCSR